MEIINKTVTGRIMGIVDMPQFDVTIEDVQILLQKCGLDLRFSYGKDTKGNDILLTVIYNTHRE